MITIHDNDMAIDVVAKLITATKPIKNTTVKMMNRILGGNGTEDLFTDEELLEMAEYLEAYARHNIRAKNDMWIPAKRKTPEQDVIVLVIVSGKYKNITFDNSYEMASYSKDEGWKIEGYGAWTNPEVKYWMEMPSLPEDLKEG